MNFHFSDFQRSVILFCLGLFLGNETHYLRILGVLQRLGISYFVVATICMLCMERSTDQKGAEKWVCVSAVMLHLPPLPRPRT